MIASGIPIEFTPSGYHHQHGHPGLVYDLHQDDEPPLNLPHSILEDHSNPEDLLPSLKGFSLQDSTKPKAYWKLKEGKDEDVDEELFISGCVVYWSIGGRLHKSFALESSVLQAIWCEFFIKSLKPRLMTEQNIPLSIDDPKRKGIAILEQSSTLNFFQENGEHLIQTLPFAIAKIWPSPYGLFLERTVTKQDTLPNKAPSLPYVFSLLHPLDELSPVATIRHQSQSGHESSGLPLSYFSSPEEKVVDVITTSQKRTFLITYHHGRHFHCLWKVRFTTLQESKYCVDMAPSLLGETTQNSTGNLSSQQHHSLSKHHQPSSIHHHSRGHQPKSHSTFGHTTASSLASPHLTNQMATLSRSFSPLPHAPNTPSTSHYGHFGLCDVGPLAPDLCVDLSWIETPKTCIPEPAGKVFFSFDLIEQEYFVTHHPDHNILRLLKYETTSDGAQMIFGTSTAIQARDVASLPNHRMLVVLDLSYSLSLYSGPLKVSKIHLPSSPIYNFSSHPPPPTSLPPPSPRRSTMTSASCLPMMEHHFDDKIKLLSPVPKDPYYMDTSLNETSSSSSPIHSIRTVHRNHIYLEVNTKGTIKSHGVNYVKVEIPPLYKCSVVQQCLIALQSLLPRDIALHIYIAWYCQRNVPGADQNLHHAEVQAFLRCLLHQLGYVDLDSTDPLDSSHVSSPLDAKRPKTSSEPADEDWEELRNSNAFKQEFTDTRILYYSSLTSLHPDYKFNNPDAFLFPYIFSILFALHLVYEELKLNTLNGHYLTDICCMLYRIARDLDLKSYQDHYWIDFPNSCSSQTGSQISQDDRKKVLEPPFFQDSPPHVYKWMINTLKGGPFLPLPYLPGVTIWTQKLALLYESLADVQQSSLVPLIAPGHKLLKDEPLLMPLQTDSLAERLILQMTQLGITRRNLGHLPLGVSFFLLNAILQARKNPPSDWPPEAYILLGREDLYLKPEINVHSTKLEEDIPEFLYDEVTKHLFKKDMRIVEAFRLLQSSRPVEITIQQQPNVSDHEFIEEQEKQLYSLSIRTMALPVGRGMFTLRSCRPVITETLPIPKLCLSGKAIPKKNTIEITHIDVPPNMNMWPLFHNGVASGLRISTSAAQVDATWIMYNKPCGSGPNLAESPLEHAGFLLGLGLNNHLCKLSSIDLYEYLSKVHELTTIGVLLGIAASKRGTMDTGTTKVLSIHIEALLPGGGELEVGAGVQTAALLALGLLYQGSCHLHMAEVALSEIGRPPGPEMEHCLDRESYALTAGLALGLITLGKLDQMSEIISTTLTDHLYRYMVGGYKRQMESLRREKYKSPSYQIREGDAINIDVTSPGATLALGLMYFNSGNQSVANWMTTPETQYLLDLIRPDFLLLRTLSKGLILWSSVMPERWWVEQHLPEIVKNFAFKKGLIEDSTIDFETMSQAYCNVIAGACFCMGLKFAGSANGSAFETLLYYAKHFLSLSGKSGAEQAGRITVDTCLNVIVLSLSLVMAGTGDLQVLRLCRHLRAHLGQPTSCSLYGFHMATHMALGFLFLGGGRYTLSTSPESIAALICSLFPKFPTHSNDNRYHLQAFRHLYVLAVEPRLIIPRNFETKKVQSGLLEITFKPTELYEAVSYQVEAPCLLPELHLLQKVKLVDENFWKLEFDCDKNWEKLRSFLQDGGELYVKPRANNIPFFSNDTSLLAYSFQNSKKQEFLTGPYTLPEFLSFPLSNSTNFSIFEKVVDLTSEEGISMQEFALLLAECRAQEKMELLSTCLALLELKERPQLSVELWQLKLVLTFQDWCRRCQKWTEPLHPQFIHSLQQHVERSAIAPLLGKWQGVQESLQLHNKENHTALQAFIIMNDIPPSLVLHPISKDESLPVFYLKNKSRLNLSLKSQMALLRLVNS